MAETANNTPALDGNGRLNLDAWSPPKLSFYHRVPMVQSFLLSLFITRGVEVVAQLAGLPPTAPLLLHSLLARPGQHYGSPMQTLAFDALDFVLFTAMFEGLRRRYSAASRMKRMKRHADHLVSIDRGPGSGHGDTRATHRGEAEARRESNRIRRLASPRLVERDSPVKSIVHRGFEVTLA